MSPRIMDSGPAVLCMLQSSIGRHGYDEVIEKLVESATGCLALHEESLCLMDEPCVIICKGCNSRNLCRTLVHESIHHVLLRLDGDGFLGEDETFDAACRTIASRPEFRFLINEF